MKTGTIADLRIFTGSKSESGTWVHSLCDGSHHLTYTLVPKLDTAGNFVGGSGSFSGIKECDGSCKNAPSAPEGYPFGDPETWIKTSLMEKMAVARMMGG